jgi:hypothetical protein
MPSPIPVHVTILHTSPMWAFFVLFQMNNCRTNYTQLPDLLNNFLMSFLCYPSQQKPLLTHCKHELLHQVWWLMLDDKFLDAYQHSIILQCGNGVIQRVYPWIFTYAADYPEKWVPHDLWDILLTDGQSCFSNNQRTCVMSMSQMFGPAERCQQDGAEEWPQKTNQSTLDLDGEPCPESAQLHLQAWL